MPDIRNTGNGLVPVEEPKGAWLVYGYDTQPYPVALFHNEIDALRYLAEHFYNQVRFWEWGEW